MLSHESIVKLQGLCLTSNPMFALLEYAEIGTLESAISTSSPTSTQLCLTIENYLMSIMIEIVRAVAHCHGMPTPVIHRDLKSDNVLLRDDLSCFVSDFGEAATLSKDGNSHLDGVGTPFYVSPENVLSEEIDEKSDIFSLAMLILELSSYYLQRIALEDG